MNLKLILLVIAVIAGGIIGFATAPRGPSIQFDGGGVAIDVQTGESLNPWGRVGLFALVGGLIGLGLGLVADRGR